MANIHCRIVNRGLEKYLKYIYLDHQQTESGLFAAEQVKSVGQIMDSTTYYEASQVIVLDLGFEVSSDAEFVAQIVTPPTYTEQWIYEYDVRDHLGNLRLTYSDLNDNGSIDSKAEILQRIDYYPYGMRRNHYERTTLKNNYQYNSIEHVNDFGLDLSMATYRSLDGALGMWGQVDPKAEHDYSRSPYNSMYNNPISNIDPNGDSPILIGMGIGAILGGINGGWEGALKGAIAGGIGAGAGMAAVSAWGVGGVGFGAGAINGAIGGSAGGFAGGATGAWMNGATFGEGLAAGGIGAGIGGLTGGAIGDVGAGLDAVKHGGKFWSGDGYTTYSTAVSPSGGSENPVQYNQKTAEAFSDKHFGEVEGLNKLRANGTSPSNLTYKDGYFKTPEGNALGVTTYNRSTGLSDVYLAKNAFTSSEQLYLTMGHEYIHVAFNYAGLSGVSSLAQHATIRNWEYSQALEFQFSGAGKLGRIANSLNKHANPVYNRFCYPLVCGNPF